MKKHLKGLGIALVVALSMSVSASAAQAESFKSASYPASMSGEQTTQLKFSLGATGRYWVCSNVRFASQSLSSASSTLSLYPYLDGCSFKTVMGTDLDTTMVPGDCTLKLLEPAGKQGGASVDCPAGQSILVNVYNGVNVLHTDANRICQYSIAGQASQGVVQYVNNPLTMTASMNLSVSIKRIVGTTTQCGAIEQTMSPIGSILLTGSNGKIEVG